MESVAWVVRPLPVLAASGVLHLEPHASLDSGLLQAEILVSRLRLLLGLWCKEARTKAPLELGRELVVGLVRQAVHAELPTRTGTKVSEEARGRSLAGLPETYVLVEVVMPREVLQAARPLALERCREGLDGQRHAREQPRQVNSRRSLVWIDRVCLLRCSLRLKHLPQAGTAHKKIFLGLPVLVRPQ